MSTHSNFLSHEQATAAIRQECVVCFGEATELISCVVARWYAICKECNDPQRVCTNCHQEACRRATPRNGELDAGQLRQLFKGNREAEDALSGMNPEMYLKVAPDGRSFDMGVRRVEIPPEHVTRSSSSARFFGTREGARLELDTPPEDIITGFSIRMCRATTLAEGVRMVRTTRDPVSGETTAEDLGDARSWVEALRYGTAHHYPTIFLHTSHGKEPILLLLAMNPNMPGAIVRMAAAREARKVLAAGGSTVVSAVDLPAGGSTVVSAVDLPAKVWGDVALINDADTHVFRVDGVPQVLNVRFRDASGLLRGVGEKLTPHKRFLDATGCLVEEFHGLPRCAAISMKVRSLRALRVYPVDSSVRLDGTWELDEHSSRATPLDLRDFWDNSRSESFTPEPSDRGNVFALETRPRSGVFIYKAVLITDPPTETDMGRKPETFGTWNFHAYYEDVTPKKMFTPTSRGWHADGYFVETYTGLERGEGCVLEARNVSGVYQTIDSEYVGVKSDGTFDLASAESHDTAMVRVNKARYFTFELSSSDFGDVYAIRNGKRGRFLHVFVFLPVPALKRPLISPSPAPRPAPAPRPVPEVAALSGRELSCSAHYVGHQFATFVPEDGFPDDDGECRMTIFCGIVTGRQVVLTLGFQGKAGAVWPVFADLDANGGWNVAEADRDAESYVSTLNDYRAKFTLNRGDHGYVCALVNGRGSTRVLHQFLFFTADAMQVDAPPAAAMQVDAPPAAAMQVDAPPTAAMQVDAAGAGLQQPVAGLPALGRLDVSPSANYVRSPDRSLIDTRGPEDEDGKCRTTVFSNMNRLEFELKLKCSYAVGNLFTVRAELDANGGWDFGEARRLPGQHMRPGSSRTVKDALGYDSHGVVIALVDGESSKKVLHQFLFVPSR